MYCTRWDGQELERNTRCWPTDPRTNILLCLKDAINTTKWESVVTVNLITRQVRREVRAPWLTYLKSCGEGHLGAHLTWVHKQMVTCRRTLSNILKSRTYCITTPDAGRRGRLGKKSACIREISDLNLGPKTSCSEDFRGCSQSLQINAEIVPETTITSFHIFSDSSISTATSSIVT
jgi:hypothetical protein